MTEIPIPAPDRASNPSESPWQYFMDTFGTGHPLAKHVVGIRALISAVARDAMFGTFGEKWCTVYPWNDSERGFAKQSADYGLTVIFCMTVTLYPHDNHVTARWLDEQRFSDGVAAAQLAEAA
jgi:hypothetical protein